MPGGFFIFDAKAEGIKVEKATQRLARYWNADPRRFGEIVTGDEMWLYFVKPDCKENMKVCIRENSEKHPIAGRNDFQFPLPLGVWEALRFVIVALPGLFSYLFFQS